MKASRPVAAALIAAVTLAACRPGFQPRAFPSSIALFKASMTEYNAKRYDNAVTGFERLTLDLAARDTLLPLSHWYLAQAHELKGEHLLAASSYARLAESFPDDSLAPRALLLAGRSYSELWRRPDLDPTYGDLAQIQFRQLATLYPDSPYKKQADSASLDIDERKASKDFENGMYYVRRKGYESSLIYFKDVVKDYPLTKTAHDALIEMVKVYRRPELKYLPEAAETCLTLRTAYPVDATVGALCPAPGNAAADSTQVKAKNAAPRKKPAD
ncbi:MAG TPA: outer membrane protein assembly factor BamD [Gemmatimonadaceae bacterium]|nr:outer membrane protein assembly factor BamD [Gemmatimonadaceae bacterium]